MRKVLIVAYSFPPVGGAGVQRSVKFVKYLREFAWEPLVLTVANPSVPVLDEALLKDVPENTIIYHARTLEPTYSAKQAFAGGKPGTWSLKAFIKKCFSIFMLPDLQILWWPGLMLKMIEVVRREKPDCMFVSAPPFSSFIPVVIAGKAFRVPVVLDYRDEWSFSRTNSENSTKNSLAFALDVVFERFVLNHCYAFTVATQSYLDEISSRYGAGLGAKGVVITNGYDLEDFAVPTDVIKYSSPYTEHITIVYAGTVWNATSLKTFCTALTGLLDERPDIKQKIRLKVFGRVVDSERACMDADALRGIVECCGYSSMNMLFRKYARLMFC